MMKVNGSLHSLMRSESFSVTQRVPVTPGGKAEQTCTLPSVSFQARRRGKTRKCLDHRKRLEKTGLLLLKVRVLSLSVFWPHFD